MHGLMKAALYAAGWFLYNVFIHVNIRRLFEYVETNNFHDLQGKKFKDMHDMAYSFEILQDRYYNLVSDLRNPNEILMFTTSRSGLFINNCVICLEQLRTIDKDWKWNLVAAYMSQQLGKFSESVVEELRLAKA